MKKKGLNGIVKKYSYLCVLYILFSYILTQVVVDGSNRIAQATDALFAGETLELKKFLVPFVLLMFIGAIAAFGKSLMKNSFSLNIQTAMKNTIVQKMVKLEYQYLDEKGTGALMNRLISDIYEIEALFSELIPAVLMDFVTIVTVCIYINSLSTRLLLVTIVCYPVLFWLANKFTRSLGKLTGKRRSLYDDLENVALDAFHGITVGRSFNLYEIQNARIEKIIQGILDNEYIRTRIGMLSLVMGDIVRWMPRLMCYIFALYETSQQHMSIGSCMAYVMLLDRLVRPLGNVPNYLVSIREYGVSLQRLLEILKQPNEKSGEAVFEIHENESVLELQQVAFSYTDGKAVLKDISFSVERGEQIALVGGSGSGKTTVMKLLCGFYQPSSGKCQMYGHDYQEWNLETLRQQLALVSQNVFLFPGTIAENVAYGKNGATREEVEEACKQANIHAFIMTLPQGYDTLVGERGARLSGGQRQRISIARAILKNAPILLMDEPTSAVDVETEQLIQDAMRKVSEGRTVITIAHRLSTIQDADLIYVFEKGHIVESGTHKILMEKNGAYCALYQKETEERSA